MQDEFVEVIRNPQNTIMIYWFSRKCNSLNAVDVPLLLIVMICALLLILSLLLACPNVYG